MDKCRALDDVGREPAVLPSSEDEVSTLPGTIVEVVTLPGSLLEEASFSGFESERMATLVGSQQQAAGAWFVLEFCESLGRLDKAKVSEPVGDA